ncbi:fumarylacetoacetate hydrolase family protein [Arcobacter sp. LA11]|uniref:fumarylacetoacetate hydrolase family protein n=1 Tax=Arcobacter sp. LA11 TaxID=1898176 RepID=UPI000935559D|nr:fumarylacetoacetate hydrolase family protein [Arcobacter sp. LA11]
MKKLSLVLFFILSLNLLAKEIQIVRYEYNDKVHYGKINKNTIQPLEDNIYKELKPHGNPIPLSKVKLLLPTKPQNVFAVGMNFASHLASSSNMPPPLFFKSPSSLIKSGETVFLPKDSKNVHFEGELVLVIGKKTKNVSIKEAPNYIFGVTVGNDLTERNWQSEDLQWMRAKASDGFGPIGSRITIGVDYNNLLLTTKLNGEIVQQENTKYMIHKPAKVVSYLSKYFTLMPGDLIYMGTPGRTQSLNNADIVSVEIEKLGKVVNTIKE